MNNEPSTSMIFRKDKYGVFALFPYCKWDYRTKRVTAYAHIGQHFGTDYVIEIQYSRPATQQEYQPLLNELKSIGYNPRIIRRANYKRMYRL